MSRSYKRNAPYTVISRKNSAQSPELRRYLRDLAYVPRFSAKELRELDKRLSKGR